MIEFTNIEYLRTGNERQKKAYAALTEGKIFECLRKYNPILTGTIPIEIDLPDSDLDIICECTNREDFHQCIVVNFSAFEDFKIGIKNLNGIESTIASFKFLGFKIEIFGQNIPSFKQDAFRHMLIEYQILREKGLKFREEIKQLKSQGLETEPAFAQLLGLKGNSYLELLKKENNIQIGEIKESEIVFLNEMLYQAIYVPEGTTLPREIIKHPDLFKYIEDFGRADDYCLVAKQMGKLIGAIWIRLFPIKNKGYGFVDNKTPEISMAVLKEYRNSGVGRLLLLSLIERFTNDKYENISLSVDKSNYAYRFYKKYGFLDYKETEKSITMIRRMVQRK